MKNVFIVNLSSRTGKAKEIWNELEAYMKTAGIQYEAHFTKKAMDATEFAREATSKNEPLALFVMGGDGTLNEALNGIQDFENTFYTPLPAGSANDFVLGINLKGSALDILKRALASEDYKTFDIGRVEYDGGSRVFGVSAGIGVDAYVCLQALTSKLKKFLNRFGLGSATYGLLTVGDIFTMPFSNASVTLLYKGREEIRSIKGTIFAAAMNCPAEGGGIPMAPKATADSGHLTAFIAHDLSRLKCLTLLPYLVAGKHEGKPGFDLLNFDKIKIKMDSKMCVHADGEHVGFFEEISFECLPQILKIKGF